MSVLPVRSRRAPKDETAEQRTRRQGANAMRDILDQLEEDLGLCATAITIDGLIEGMADFIADRIGREAAIRKLSQAVTAASTRPDPPRRSAHHRRTRCPASN
jgi:hypothetical protein